MRTGKTKVIKNGKASNNTNVFHKNMHRKTEQISSLTTSSNDCGDEAVKLVDVDDKETVCGIYEGHY